MCGPAPYMLHVVTEYPNDNRRFKPNVNSTPVALGTWHLIEWYVKYATTSSSADGVVTWWMDRVLQGKYVNVQTPADGGYINFKISPTWGGGGSTKTETDYYWFDHVVLSRRAR